MLEILFASAYVRDGDVKVIYPEAFIGMVQQTAGD